MAEASVLHRSVAERMKNCGYRPSNLPKEFTFDAESSLQAATIPFPRKNATSSGH
jgi:hypothetical protein